MRESILISNGIINKSESVQNISVQNYKFLFCGSVSKKSEDQENVHLESGGCLMVEMIVGGLVVQEGILVFRPLSPVSCNIRQARYSFVSQPVSNNFSSLAYRYMQVISEFGLESLLSCILASSCKVALGTSG